MLGQSLPKVGTTYKFPDYRGPPFNIHTIYKPRKFYKLGKETNVRGVSFTAVIICSIAIPLN
jgi:hypothetical protein